MSLSHLILTALRGVSANKLRAALTMLGIIIGVASVIAMLALGNGARVCRGSPVSLPGGRRGADRRDDGFRGWRLCFCRENTFL